MNDPIDQLKEWWEIADQVAPMRGDLIIEDVTDEYGPDYRIRNWPGDMREKLSYVRVLEPKPKPAWHDAVAVIAQTAGRDDRRPFIRDDDGWWEDADCSYEADELAYVTPLIEAKVTDEMVERYWAAMRNPGSNYDEAVRHALAAALGLEAK